MRRIMRLGIFVTVLLLAILPANANAQATEPSEADRADFVIGNVIFVMLHEFAHVLTDDFNIPILDNGELIRCNLENASMRGPNGVTAHKLSSNRRSPPGPDDD